MSGTTVLTSSIMFSERDQSIWGGGRAITTEKRIPIIDAHYKTGPWALDVGIGDLSISGAQFDLDVTAVLGFTAGSMSIDYPVDAVVELPNAATPGQTFSVQTRAVMNGISPLILSTSPGFDVRIDVSAYAGVDNVYFEADEINILGVNVNPIQDINFGSPHLGPFNVGIPIPLSKTFTYKGIDIKVAVPEPFSTTAEAFVPSGLVLPQLRTGGDQFEHDVEEGGEDPGLDSGFLTVTGNIMNMSPIPTSFKVSQIELTTLAVNLIGGIGFAQEYTFTPTR